MDIKQSLIKKHTKANTVRLARLVSADAELLDELIRLILLNEEPVSHRGAWVLTHIRKKYKAILEPYLEALLLNLANPNLPAGTKRNTLKVFETRDIPVQIETQGLDICIALLRNKSEAIAVRVFAMTVLVNMCMKYPELKHEITEIIKEQYDETSPAYVSRAKRELKRLAALVEKQA